jgi:hypothetical protein
MRSLWVGEASGATYYVAPTGSDGNPGTIAQPFGTINRGAALLRAGDTLYLRGGTYYQTVYAPASGTPAAPVTISGYQSETAIIDGAFTNPVSSWGNLFLVQGSNSVVRNLTIRRSNWIGLALSGPYEQAIGINSQSNMENGIIVTGSASYSVVDSCQVFYNAKSNEGFLATRGQWSTGLSSARGPSYVTLRGNQVWNNWGEGMSSFESLHTLMESNVVYDNQLNIYISDSKYATCEGNIVYSTPGNVCSNSSQVGIALADEQFNPPSSDNTVINNLLLGNAKNIYFWSGGAGAGLVNVVIANNTFANSVVETNLKLGSGSHTNSVIENNIFLQSGSLPVAVVMTPQGITFSHNLWSKTPSAAASGSGDVLGNPDLAQTGPTGAGQLTPDWFGIPSNSPAVGRGVTPAVVQTDFYGRTRGLLPDVGAIEHSLLPPTNLRVTSSN